MQKKTENSRRNLGVIGSLAAAGALSLLAASNSKDINDKTNATHNEVEKVLNDDHNAHKNKVPSKNKKGSKKTLVSIHKSEAEPKETVTQELKDDKELAKKALEGDYNSAYTLYIRGQDILHELSLKENYSYNEYYKMWEERLEEIEVDLETYRMIESVVKLRRILENIEYRDFSDHREDGEGWKFTDKEIESKIGMSLASMIIILKYMDNPFDPLNLKLLGVDHDGLRDLVRIIIDYSEADARKTIYGEEFFTVETYKKLRGKFDIPE